MRTITLELEKMSSLPALHNYLHQALELPEYYGANLDALYDCLTEIAEPTKLIISKKVGDAEQLGWYGQQLLCVLNDAASDNEALQVEITE
ncbi:MAG: barstar family protein [Phascolarctobacterium sp.]|nr:barstar family protein [Phascolarctobacterium sp.]